MTLEVATSYDMMLEQTELFLMRLDAMARKVPILRYGQAFINSFTGGIHWPELYHERDEAKARETIREYLIRNQNAGHLHTVMDAIETKLKRY